MCCRDECRVLMQCSSGLQGKAVHEVQSALVHVSQFAAARVSLSAWTHGAHCAVAQQQSQISWQYVGFVLPLKAERSRGRRGFCCAMELGDSEMYTG